jgi:ribosome-binding protein aMBF1 (putative translation factor)
MKACGKSLKEGDIITVDASGVVLCEECSADSTRSIAKRGCLSPKAVKQLGKIACGGKVPLTNKARVTA